jgi:hypothetical protein
MAFLDRLDADELVEHGSGKLKPKRQYPPQNDKTVSIPPA